MRQRHCCLFNNLFASATTPLSTRRQAINKLECLRAFIQTVKSGSFTAAAEHLHLSRPSISKSIAQLELELGTRLFNRTTRRLHLTAEGRGYFDKVSAILDQLEQADQQLKESHLGATGLVRVSSINLFGKYYIVPLLPTFFARYPQVRLEMSFDDTELDFVRDELDVGIVRGSRRSSSRISRHLYQLQLVVVASPAYLASHGIPKIPEDLASHECINVRLPTGELPLWEFERIDQATGKSRSKERFILNPKGRLVTVGQFDSVISSTAAGLGIAICHPATIASYLSAGDLKILLPEYRVRGIPAEPGEICIQYPHREYVPLKTRVFIDFLLEQFREREALQPELTLINQYAARE